MNLDKLKSRKFAAVSSSSLLALANETMGMGIDRSITIAIIAAGVLYAAIEAMVDVGRMKYGAVEKKVAK